MIHIFNNIYNRKINCNFFQKFNNFKINIKNFELIYYFILNSNYLKV